MAGLERIGRRDAISEVIDPEVMVPALGAGALALQCREGDTELIAAVGALDDENTHREVTAERKLLHVLQGHCDSPIAGFARAFRDGELSLRARVFSADGKKSLHAHEWAGPLDPETLGTSVGVALLRQGARDLIDGTGAGG